VAGLTGRSGCTRRRATGTHTSSSTSIAIGTGTTGGRQETAEHTTRALTTTLTVALAQEEQEHNGKQTHHAKPERGHHTRHNHLPVHHCHLVEEISPLLHPLDGRVRVVLGCVPESSREFKRESSRERTEGGEGESEQREEREEKPK
jgi:hypothetical protein